MSDDPFPAPPSGAAEDQCEAIFAPISSTSLDAICKEQGWDIPSDYRCFLLRWNGFQLKGKSLVFSRNEPRDELQNLVTPYRGYDECVEVLYGIGEGGCNDLRHAQGSYFFGELLAIGRFLHIGHAVNNHVLCMSLNASDFGAIYSWEAAEEYLDSPLEMLLLNAGSFREFWSRLSAMD